MTRTPGPSEVAYKLGVEAGKVHAPGTANPYAPARTPAARHLARVWMLGRLRDVPQIPPDTQ